MSEVVQKDGELCALYRSYQNARKRLSEKVRFRGFWKVKSSEEGKSKRVQGFQRPWWPQTVVGQSHSFVILSYAGCAWFAVVSCWKHRRKGPQKDARKTQRGKNADEWKACFTSIFSIAVVRSGFYFRFLQATYVEAPSARKPCEPWPFW